MTTKSTRVVTTTVRMGKTVVARLLPGTDLTEGIIKACEDNGMRSAVVLSCLGSLTGAALLLPAKQQKPDGTIFYAYGDPVLVPGPLSLLGARGIYTRNEAGKPFLHLHGSVALVDGRTLGGHCAPGQNPTYLVVEVVIAELVGSDLLRRHDTEVGAELLLGLG